MPTTISFVADDSFSALIDKMIKKTGMYTSKSEFMRDAARTKLIQMMGLEENLKDIQAGMAKLRKKANYQGELTPQLKDEIARKYLKKLEGLRQ